MLSIFEAENYKKLVLERLKGFPKAGHGQFRKIAERLRVHPVIITQVFKGSRDLTEEQAIELADYLGFTKLESQYFLSLVQIERAGTVKLKAHYEERRRELLDQSKDLKTRVFEKKALSEEAKAMFYSNWFYSGVRLASSFLNTPEKLSEYLGVPLPVVHRVLEFLLSHGLVVQTEKGLDMGPAITHVEASSPLASRHHMNWRMQAMKRVDRAGADELFFTFPIVISAATQSQIREVFVQAIEKCMPLVKDSSSEKLACVNIDLFNVEK